MVPGSLSTWRRVRCLLGSGFVGYLAPGSLSTWRWIRCLLGAGFVVYLASGSLSTWRQVRCLLGGGFVVYLAAGSLSTWRRVRCLLGAKTATGSTHDPELVVLVSSCWFPWFTPLTPYVILHTHLLLHTPLRKL